MSLVLIADDEPALLEAFCEIVTDLGYECVPARDGEEAFELAQSRRPDIVIADYMMPGMGGVELIRALRADSALKAIPVILVSAGTPLDADEAFRFLAKPISPDVLQQSLADGLRTRGAGSGREPTREASTINAAREEMLNWVAHEIKSPLAAAMMSAQLMRRELESGERPGTIKRRVEVVLRQLGRMDELVSSVLADARIKDG